jgi:hypothetical protein
MTAWVKVAGTWRQFNPKVLVGGTWRTGVQGYVKVAGIWKKFTGPGFPLAKPGDDTPDENNKA